MEDTFVSDYALVTADTANDLESRVKDKLRKGWELRGGVSVAYDCDTKDFRYVQTMVELRSTKRF